jgi:GNAT superfamily N-acetyltransferase
MHVFSAAERPDLVEPGWRMPSTLPAFAFESLVAERLLGRLPALFPDLRLVAVEDGPDGEEVVAHLHAAAFAWDGDDASLPDRGWEGILEQACADADAGRSPTAVSLLEASVRADRQGGGRSRILIEEARRRTADRGLEHLFGPVRPSAKHREPGRPMAEYALAVREDGLPVDPWMRVHARLGARVVKVCPVSMTIAGTLAQWRTWSGQPLEASGDVVIPGGLVPLHVDVEAGHAVYVEPNVWMHHRLEAAR